MKVIWGGHPVIGRRLIGEKVFGERFRNPAPGGDRDWKPRKPTHGLQSRKEISKEGLLLVTIGR